MANKPKEGNKLMLVVFALAMAFMLYQAMHMHGEAIDKLKAQGEPPDMTYDELETLRGVVAHGHCYRPERKSDYGYAIVPTRDAGNVMLFSQEQESGFLGSSEGDCAGVRAKWGVK